RTPAATVSSLNHGGSTTNGRLIPRACSAACVSKPLVVTVTPATSSSDRLATDASSQPLPPSRLLELWPSVTAASRTTADCPPPVPPRPARRPAPRPRPPRAPAPCPARRAPTPPTAPSPTTRPPAPPRCRR